MSGKKKSDFRTFRGYQLVNQQEGQLTPALEDYLEMIYRLCLENDYARVGKLSELLNVRPSSASKMIAKLASLDYIQYDRYEIILLTESGRKKGAYLLRRHEAVESFLRLIGSENALEETELIEHSLSPSTVSNLTALLEFFQRNDALWNQFVVFQGIRKMDPERAPDGLEGTEGEA
ncbi:MAG TPA: iron dependent repressor, metal binding and dimerization domain protein [Clostridia bacterium]|nr:iron dependent repressor, metal binding and dimerization domain protein [Clostridia bacterium]